MCKVFLCTFHLARHVKESPHLGVEAAVQLWPLKPWTHSQANTTQHRPVRTQQNRRAALLTGSHGIRSDDCVGECMCVFVHMCQLSQTTKPHRDGCQSEAWCELGRGMKGMEDRRMETSGWGWRDNQDLTALIFLFPGGVYTHGCWGENMSPSDSYWPHVIFVEFVVNWTCLFSGKIQPSTHFD